MRKTKQIEIEIDDGTKKQVVIKELSVAQIEGLVYSMDLQKLSAPETSLTEELKSFFQNKLIPLTTNLTLDEVMKMYPSDLEEVIVGLQEVNKSFFTLMIKLNVVEWAKGVLELLGRHLLQRMVSGQSAANSLKQDTQTPPTTDTLIS